MYVCIDSVRRYLGGTNLGEEWRIPESELSRLAGSGPTVPFGHRVSKIKIAALAHAREVLDFLLHSARQAAQRVGTSDSQGTFTYRLEDDSVDRGNCSFLG